jgi:hypothetical protein
MLPPKTVQHPLTPPPETSDPTTTQDLGLCIAHYNEDLTWLAPFASNTTIYSKGPDKANPSLFPTTFSLPNIGRETHTYLTHIVRNYATLPRVTLFLQGNIHDINDGTPAHTDATLAEIASMAKSLAPGAVLPIGAVLPFSSFDSLNYKPDWVRRRGATLVRSKLSPAQFWAWLFEGAIPPQEIRFVQGACYGVSREAVWRRSQAWWARLLAYFEDWAERNPEEGHYMERFWWAVFEPDVAVVRT